MLEKAHMGEARFDARRPKGGPYSLTWRAPNSSKACSTEAAGLDISQSGIGIDCPTELKLGSIVFVQARDGSIEAECEVVHCTRHGATFHVGLEIREDNRETQRPAARKPAESEPDHYETLQISRKADMETIHRVFRIMALRFHPDNPETGDLERFLGLKRAYAVLSDPQRRSEYDAVLAKDHDDGPSPVFVLKDFVTGVEAESNRRLGVLCLLYRKRQTNPDAPGVSLLDLEREMGFPREYLSFTIWYLRAKEYIHVADNSDYALTAAGADFVEKKAVRHEIVARLLNPAMRVPKPGTTLKNQQKSPGRRLLTA